MSDSNRPEIDISHVKVAGIGGLGMIVVVAAMAYAMPTVRWFVSVSLAGGLAIGVMLILAHRLRRPNAGSPPPHADSRYAPVRQIWEDSRTRDRADRASRSVNVPDPACDTRRPALGL